MKNMTYTYGPNVYGYWNILSDSQKMRKERAFRRMMHRFDERIETQARKNERMVKRMMQEAAL